MSRIGPDPKLPIYRGGDSYQSNLNFQLIDFLRKLATQLNLLSEGNASAVTNAYTAAPTTGTWKQGDEIKNSAPSEAGSAGSKYVVVGWKCVASGTPGTWVAMRCLTGN